MKNPRTARALDPISEASYASAGESPSSIIESVVAFLTLIVVLNSPLSRGRQTHWMRTRPFQALMAFAPAQPSSSCVSGSAVARPAVSKYDSPVTVTAALPYEKRQIDDSVPSAPWTL